MYHLDVSSVNDESGCGTRVISTNRRTAHVNDWTTDERDHRIQGTNLGNVRARALGAPMASIRQYIRPPSPSLCSRQRKVRGAVSSSKSERKADSTDRSSMRSTSQWYVASGKIGVATITRYCKITHCHAVVLPCLHPALVSVTPVVSHTQCTSRIIIRNLSIPIFQSERQDAKR